MRGRDEGLADPADPPPQSEATDSRLAAPGYDDRPIELDLSGDCAGYDDAPLEGPLGRLHRNLISTEFDHLGNCARLEEMLDGNRAPENRLRGFVMHHTLMLSANPTRRLVGKPRGSTLLVAKDFWEE